MRAKASLKAGGLTDEFVPITFTVTAVRIKGQVILFDAGSVLDQAQIKTINHHAFSS
jgi:hypothetical protein